MWFYPADSPDYFFVCQECKHTQRVSGADIARVIWNFRACRSCQSTNLPFTLPISRSASESGTQIADAPPQLLLRGLRNTAEAATGRPALSNPLRDRQGDGFSFADLP